MLLEESLLSDYGDIPQKIGLSLLKNNAASFISLKNSTGLSDEDLRDGLSILIQRRFVSFFIFEKSIKYHIDSQSIKRRLYFPIYSKYIHENYSSKHAKYFLKVLLSGVYKETEENEILTDLMNDSILQIDMTRNAKGSKKALKKLDLVNIDLDEDKTDIKSRKFSLKYLIVNYSQLDYKIYETELVKYVSKRYNEATGSVLKAILKCNIVDRNNILKNLETTKILINSNGMQINEKDNINEYIRYLVLGGIVQRGMDETKMFYVNSCI